MNQKQLHHVEKLTKEYLANVKDLQHDFDHANRVRKKALNIADILGVKNDIDLNLLQASCLLHDLTYSRKNPIPLILIYIIEGFLAKSFVNKALKTLNISDQNRQIITKTISKHSKSFPFKKLNKKEDLYTKILQDADTLDFFNKQRIENFKNINGFTKKCSLLINLFVSYGKKNINKFLNFPELALYFLQNNGFSYLEWGTTNSDEETLLCIHGYTDSSLLFAPFAKKVSNRYKIIALDLPMKHKAKICSITQLANYLENFRKKIGLKKFNLVGFSLGGLVAIEYSIIYPNRVSNLYLLNSLPSPILSDVLRKLFKHLKPLLLLKPSLYIYSRINTNKLIKRLLPNRILNNEQKDIMRSKYIPIFGTLLNNLDYSKTKEFNNLSLPKMIILFKDDEIINWNHVRNYAKSLNGKLKVFHKGGHITQKKYWSDVANLF